MSKQNKRGNVALGILFFAGVFLMVSSLFVFLTASGNFESSSNELSEMMFEIDFAERYVIENSKVVGREAIKSDGNPRDNFIEGMAERDLRFVGAGNFFGKIRTGDFVFKEQDEGYILEIRDVFVIAEKENNKIRRNFDILIEFDEDGNVLD